MKKEKIVKNKYSILNTVAVIILAVIILQCGEKTSARNSSDAVLSESNITGKDSNSSVSLLASDNNADYQVTFIELGSVKCIPCRMMQPVMKNIEKKYGAKIRVIFYDVWTEAGMPYSKKYNIRVIPTQVFLDSDGNEFYRHQGFFPEAEIVKLLDKKLGNGR